MNYKNAICLFLCAMTPNYTSFFTASRWTCLNWSLNWSSRPRPRRRSRLISFCSPSSILPGWWSKSLSPDRTGRLGFGDDLFLNFIYNLIWILLLIIYFLIMTSTWFRNFLQLVIIVGIFLSSFFCSFIIYLPHWLHECFFSPMLSLMWESIGKSCITLRKVSRKSTLPFGRFVRLGIRVDTTNFLLFQ